MKAKVSVACDNNEYHIKVEGRATFEVSPSLRNLALRIGNSLISGLYIHLDNCTGMDSTFIGVLAMLGLEAKKQNAPAIIINADENNRKLLNGLGLHKIFSYTQSENSNLENKKWEDNSLPPKQEPMETAKTVLNAHETLMNLEESNIQRFKNVVDFVKKDLEKNTEKKE